MMEINRNNYEAYFIDYLEGTLDERLIDSFIAFIQANPDLKEELSLFDRVSLVPETLEFSKKKLLYKNKYDCEKEFNAAAIDRMEGYLSEADHVAFEAYLEKHPRQKTEADLFCKTKLKADESITFEKKHKLYRKSPVKILLMWSGSVAAVLIIGLLLLNLYPTKTEPLNPTPQLASVEETVPKKEITEQNTLSQLSENNSKETEIASPVVENAIIETSPIKGKVKTDVAPTKKDFVAQSRPSVNRMQEMKPITATIDTKKSEAALGTMYLYYPENNNTYEEKLLVDVVKERTGFSFRKISKAGLKLASNISNERFSYETTPDGKVKEYKYDSRLFAFSIPAKKTKPE